MIRISDILKEYTDEQRKKFTDKVEQAILNFTHGASFDNKKHDPYINAALELYPKLRYTGKLYRVMSIQADDFLQFNSNSDVLNYIKNYKTKHYMSFTKTLEGLQDFESITLSDDIEDLVPFVGINVEQVGSGLDIETFYKTFVEKGDAALSERIMDPDSKTKYAAQVGEVVAPIDKNTMQIGMYTLFDELHGKIYKYNTSNFNKLKEDLEDALADYEEYEGGDEEDDYDYELKDKTRKGFRKPPEGAMMYTHKDFHKKSKYKKYNAYHG